MMVPKRPSDDFLDKSEDRYVLYATDIARAVLRKRLLKRCGGNEATACNTLISYLQFCVDNWKDPSKFCKNFLDKFDNISYQNLITLVDRMDYSLCRKILTETREEDGLGLLAQNERDLIFNLNSGRGEAVHNKSSIHRLDLNYQKWMSDREDLRDAAIAFSSFIGPDTRTQIENYYDGIVTKYRAPAESILGQVDSLLSSTNWVQGISILLDRKITQEFYVYYCEKAYRGQFDRYISQDMGGRERSRQAIGLLAKRYEKYALLQSEQFSGEKYISYMEELIAKYGSNRGRHYLTLSEHISDPKLRRQYQRKAYAEGTTFDEKFRAELNGHFEDYCENTAADWFQITEIDRRFFRFMPTEQQRILAEKEEAAYRQYLAELHQTPLSAQIDWLRKSAAIVDTIPKESPIIQLHHAIAEQISKNQWSWQIAHVAEFVKRKPDGTYTCPAVNAPLLRDVPEYQQWLSAYEAFCKADAEEWERHNAEKLSEGIAYLSRVEKTIRREKTNLAAEYKKLCDSRSPKKQVLESLLALQRRVPAVKKQLGTPSVAADSAELNHPNQLGHENFRPFFRAYPDPKPDTLTEVFRSCDAALSEFDALEKEIKARINLLRKQIHANAQHRRVTRIAVVILLLVTGYFAVQSAVLSKSDRLMQSGNLVEAYSVLDKVSAVYSKVDTRRMECLSLIRKTMVENGYRGDIVEFPDPVYPDNPVTADPTIQSGDLCVYRKQNGTYMTQIGAYWGEVRAPEGKELLAVQQGEAYFSVVGICTDGTRVRGETSWETHPKVAQSANRAAAEAGINLEIFGEQANGFKGVWIYGGVKILMEDGSITDIFGRTNYTDVVGFVPSPDDPGNLVPVASDGSYAQPYWVSFGALPSGIHETDVFDHHYGYSAMRDGRAYSSGEWEKGNDYLFVSNSDSYLSVYDSEVQSWISSK